MRRALSACALGLLILAAPLSGTPEPVACRPSPSSAAPAPEETSSAVLCVAGFAGPYPCKNVHLMAHVPLAAMGCGGGNSLWGWTDPLDEKEYALMGCDNGISFVDISVPEAPVYLGRLPTHEHDHVGEARPGTAAFAPKHEGDSLWRDVRVYANHAFVVSEQAEHHIQVFDLTQLRDVVSPPVTFTETALYEGVETTHTVAINEDTGYVYAAGTNTCAGGLHMIDAQDPVNPTFAGCVSEDGYTHETQCVTYAGPDADYAGHEICFSANVDTLTIVDVTDKANPVQISRTGYATAAYTHQGWLTEDQRHFLLNDELDEVEEGHNSWTYVWDLADLDAPVLLGHYTGPTPAIDHNLYVRGGYAFESNYRAGLRILDVTGVATASLAEVAYFDIYPADDDPEFNANWNNYPFFPSGNVILSGIEQGLFVVRPNLNPNPTTLIAADASAGEGDTGTSVLSFEVRLSVAVPQTVTVGYQTQLQTATAGVDYEGVAGTLTFDPGVTSRTVDVTVYGDLLNETDETFRLALANPNGASMADGIAIGTIVNDDPLPALSVSDVVVAEGESGNVAASFVVSLSVPSGQDVTATLTTASGTANAGIDFVSRTAAAGLPAGTTTKVIDVQVRGDDRDEADEFFVVNLSSVSRATVADGQGTGTILDDDTLSVHSASPGSGPAAGGAAVSLAGESFENGATVEIGGVAATGVVVTGTTGITAVAPALDPGTVNEVVVALPNQTAATLPSAYLADFLDVDAAHPFHAFVEAAALSGITAGCGGGGYCPDLPVTRAQMAVFLLKAKHGAAHVPPPATGGVFGDVAAGDFAADWIEELASTGITGGCGNGNYCPGALVTRAQMAVFLLKTSESSAYVPPPAAGVFEDVPVGSFADAWIEELYARNVTGGCAAAPLRYCPGSANTRGQMAAFLFKTFDP